MKYFYSVHCVMVTETAIHFVMVRWIARPTVSQVIQKSVFLTKISRSAVQFLWNVQLADFEQLMLFFCPKLHGKQVKLFT